MSGFIAEGADLKTAATARIVDGAPSGGHYVAPTLFADVALRAIASRRRRSSARSRS